MVRLHGAPPLRSLMAACLVCLAPSVTFFVGTKDVPRARQDVGQDVVARRGSDNPLRLPKSPKNPFDLLGVRRGTEKSEIRKLFRKRVQTEHPDVNPDDPDAAERFQELVAAYNSVMGDELLPDELNFVRVQMTARYKKQLEADQSVKNGIFYALLPGITISLIGIAFFAMDSLNISEYLGP
ncbi:unnamed protein product [Cladocopium goreaui]|uniref:Blue-light-activated histidine kinase 1 n=1 Tax=Cladocopium goreaui TaxID=2562237 RepID=A0A9P1FIS2_9DINO|nr:unnamed protein product [Cladocopium goreaui]